jgi:hypothetical protein
LPRRDEFLETGLPVHGVLGIPYSPVPIVPIAPARLSIEIEILG